MITTFFYSYCDEYNVKKGKISRKSKVDVNKTGRTISVLLQERLAFCNCFLTFPKHRSKCKVLMPLKSYYGPNQILETRPPNSYVNSIFRWGL
jgi:hypothetical protein